MYEKAPICFFKPPKMTVEEVTANYALYIPNYPKEIFAFISYEDIEFEKYFITSYGRVFTNYGKELFPEESRYKDNDMIYYRIELSCSGYIKRRKFGVHRLVANAFIPKTQNDISLNRDTVNHKYNTDGRCNFAWNLEWTTDSENTLHAINYNTDGIDFSLFNFEIISSRKALYYSNNQFGDKNPKSRISEYQAHLICYAYSKLNYDAYGCAIYAWLEGNSKDISLVNSIINGYCWNSVSSQYGIVPKVNKSINRASPIREDKKDEYEEMKNKRIRKQ